MKSETSLIFVYGTLKKGQSRASFLNDSPYLGEAKTLPLYHLYSVNEMYPALVEATQSNVCLTGLEVEGEIYEITQYVLGRLDVVEGVGFGLYKRRPIELIEDYGEVESYFWGGDLDGLFDIGCRWS